MSKVKKNGSYVNRNFTVSYVIFSTVSKYTNTSKFQFYITEIRYKYLLDEYIEYWGKKTKCGRNIYFIAVYIIFIHTRYE